MQTLNLNIENRIRVNINAVALFNHFGKAHLVFAFNFDKLVENFFIVLEFAELFKLI